MLKGFDYLVDVVDDGVDALEATSKKRYDFIVMDYVMPRMSGLDVRESRLILFLTIL